MRSYWIYFLCSTVHMYCFVVVSWCFVHFLLSFHTVDAWDEFSMGHCSWWIQSFSHCEHFCCRGNPQWPNHTHCQRCRPEDHTWDSGSAQGEEWSAEQSHVCTGEIQLQRELVGQNCTWGVVVCVVSSIDGSLYMEVAIPQGMWLCVQSVCTLWPLLVSFKQWRYYFDNFAKTIQIQK